jgi:CYTH domain-containing protein
MNKEIEKKFLLFEDSKEHISDFFVKYFGSIDNLINETSQKGAKIEQGYIDLKYAENMMKILNIIAEPDFKPYEFRVRRKEKNGLEECFVTFKSDGTILRNELEKSISMYDFDLLYSLTEGKRVIKTRLNKEINGLTYEFDIYKDRSLIICEVEVNDESLLENIIPMGPDITSDKSYKNKNLAK